jgi:ribose/xylose/arabinose/galactoside ABC-type transport system permease subunit
VDAAVEGQTVLVDERPSRSSGPMSGFALRQQGADLHHRDRAMRSAVGTTERQLVVAVAALFLCFALTFGDVFTGRDNLLNVGRVGSILLVVAVGQTFALVIGGFDISVGANMGFTSVVVGLQLTHGATAGQAVLVGLSAGTAVGVVNGFMIAVLGITPFVATLGMLTFLTGFADELSEGASVNGLPGSLTRFGRGDWGPVPSAIGMAAIVLVISWFVLSRCRLGLYIFAIGGSRETARLSGVAVKRYELLAYAICGLLAGVAGVMLTSRVGVGQASLGQGYALSSVATAVIGGVAIGGGVGRLRGVILGVALISLLTAGLDIGAVDEFVQQMIMGGVLVASVVVSQQRGKSYRARLAKLIRRRVRAAPTPSAPTDTARDVTSNAKTSSGSVVSGKEN